MIQRVREGSTLLGAAGTMNELAPQGHLRPLGGRENPRRARPESRSPRRCASAWRRCLLSAGRPEGIDQGTHDRHARARPHPQLHMRKGVNRNPSRRPGLAVSDSNLHAVKMTQNWALLTPPLSRAAGQWIPTIYDYAYMAASMIGHGRRGACGVILSGSEGKLRCPRLWLVLAGGYRRWRPRAAHTTLPAGSGVDHPPSSSMDRGWCVSQSTPTAGAALREREARHWRPWLRPAVAPHLLAASSSGYPVRAG